MLKLNQSYSKKVPAEGEYSSQQYHCQIEVELPDGLNPQQLNEKVHNVFDFVRKSVETELHNNAPAQQPVQTMQLPPPVQQMPPQQLPPQTQQPVQQQYYDPQQSYPQPQPQQAPQQQYQQPAPQYQQYQNMKAAMAAEPATEVTQTEEPQTGKTATVSFDSPEEEAAPAAEAAAVEPAETPQANAEAAGQAGPVDVEAYRHLGVAGYRLAAFPDRGREVLFLQRVVPQVEEAPLELRPARVQHSLGGREVALDVFRLRIHLALPGCQQVGNPLEVLR